jgi:glycosyltransferase involved in cell wall biosynthesis
VLSEHSSWYNTVEKIPFWKRKMLQVFQKGIKICMPVSQSLGNKLVELGVESFKIAPVPNVIDKNIFFFKPMPANAKTTFLHVSNFKEHHKNMDGLLKVIKDLDKAGLDFQFIFVGDGNIEALQEKSQNLEIDINKITFHTTKTGADLAYFYQLADAFVLFSRYENLPCVLLESLCCGTPIVATRVGGISEIINDNGFLVESEDEKSLLDTMKLFIDKKVTFSKPEIAQNAQKLYSVEAISSKFIELYQKIA